MAAEEKWEHSKKKKKKNGKANGLKRSDSTEGTQPVSSASRRVQMHSRMLVGQLVNSQT